MKICYTLEIEYEDFTDWMIKLKNMMDAQGIKVTKFCENAGISRAIFYSLIPNSKNEITAKSVSIGQVKKIIQGGVKSNLVSQEHNENTLRYPKIFLDITKENLRYVSDEERISS